MLYKEFSEYKQTYKELWDRYKMWIKTIQKYLDMYSITNKITKPKKIILLIDTTYFWTFGLMVFKDSKTKKILNYKVVDYETNLAYKEWIQELEWVWRIIKAIVCDGRKWLLWWFGKTPTQMCQFHQGQIIRRYITKNPILEPNKELKEIVKWLTQTDKWTFEICLETRYQKHELFLKEKGINSEMKEILYP